MHLAKGKPVKPGTTMYYQVCRLAPLLLAAAGCAAHARTPPASFVHVTPEREPPRKEEYAAGAIELGANGALSVGGHPISLMEFARLVDDDPLKSRLRNDLSDPRFVRNPGIVLLGLGGFSALAFVSAFMIESYDCSIVIFDDSCNFEVTARAGLTTAVLAGAGIPLTVAGHRAAKRAKLRNSDPEILDPLIDAYNEQLRTRLGLPDRATHPRPEVDLGIAGQGVAIAVTF